MEDWHMPAIPGKRFILLIRITVMICLPTVYEWFRMYSAERVAKDQAESEEVTKPTQSSPGENVISTISYMIDEGKLNQPPSEANIEPTVHSVNTVYQPLCSSNIVEVKPAEVSPEDSDEQVAQFPNCHVNEPPRLAHDHVAEPTRPSSRYHAVLSGVLLEYNLFEVRAHEELTKAASNLHTWGMKDLSESNGMKV